MSFVRWISITPGRNFRFLLPPCSALRVRLSASLSSSASGCTVGSSSSISASSAEELSSAEGFPAPEAVRLFFFGGRLACGFAHSGTGYSRSNLAFLATSRHHRAHVCAHCLRKRLAYSLPLMTSSSSVRLSLRSRGTDASDTVIRSSSLSSHAGGSLPWARASSSSEGG